MRVFLLLLALAASSRAAGFTEPPIVFYGKVTNTVNGQSVDVTSGELAFTIQPPTGAPIIARTPLRAISGGYSYRLEIPVEKVPAGFTVSTLTLAAPTASASYNRNPITLDGAPVTIVLPTGPARATFTFAENQRGKIERVDVIIAGDELDTDGDGLPDRWEDQFGLDKYDASDAARDDDGDTVNNRGEYADLTDPRVYEFDYARWANACGLAGIDRPMSADGDGDGIPNGIEFGVDSDPHVPDRPLVESRVVTALETIGLQRYLVMSVRKPAQHRTRTDYTVERSLDLVTWGSLEDTHVVTLQDDDALLRVRLKQGISDPAVPRAYLRLGISETP